MIWDTIQPTYKHPITLTARHVTPYDLMDEETRKALDHIKLKIARGDVQPDEGTYEDIEWINKYPEFGRFVSIYKPGWNRCDKCGSLRLCFCDLIDLSYTCYKCKTEEWVMDCIDKTRHLDTPVVKKYLMDGVIDPTAGWKTYQQIYDEEIKRFEELSALDPLLPYMPEKEELARKLYNRLNIHQKSK